MWLQKGQWVAWVKKWPQGARTCQTADQWNLTWQQDTVHISKGKLKPGFLGGQALIIREVMPVTKATCKHQLFLSLLLPSGHLPNSPPTLIYLRDGCQERMKTSYHFLRKFKRFRVLPPKKIKKGIKKNHPSCLCQHRDLYNKYRKGLYGFPDWGHEDPSRRIRNFK